MSNDSLPSFQVAVGNEGPILFKALVVPEGMDQHIADMLYTDWQHRVLGHESLFLIEDARSVECIAESLNWHEDEWFESLLHANIPGLEFSSGSDTWITWESELAAFSAWASVGAPLSITWPATNQEVAREQRFTVERYREAVARNERDRCKLCSRPGLMPEPCDDAECPRRGCDAG